MSDKADIDDFINRWIGNYPVEGFHDGRLRSILLRLNGRIGGSSGDTGLPRFYLLTDGDFSNATDCPVTTVDGIPFRLLWNDVPKYLTETVDYNLLAGGGFSMITPGFDATANSYTFYLEPQQ